MQRINIAWYQGEDKKDQIGQIYSNGLEFACTTRTKQCSHFVYCKDFLHDAVWAQLYGKPVEIHGFVFDPNKNPIDLDLTRMLMANSSDEHFAKKIPAVIDFIHQVEKVLKLKRTKVSMCENPAEEYDNGVFFLEGSQRWMSSPPLLSMYTLLIRCGFVHTIGDSFEKTIDGIQSGKIKPYQNNDKDFVNDSRPGIDLILTLGYRKIFFIDIKKNYLEDIDTHTLHHEFGIRGYSWATHTKKKMPYWHRQAILDDLAAKGVTIKKLWEKPVHCCEDADENMPLQEEISPHPMAENTVMVSKNVKTNLGGKKLTDNLKNLSVGALKKANWNW